MSFFKPCLITLTSVLALSAVSAHADSFTTAGVYSGTVSGSSSAGELTFTFNGNTESGGGGNFTGSTGVFNGKPISFADVYCVDLTRDINTGTTYNATYSTTGVVNGSSVANAGKIAWLITNLAPLANTQDADEGLQAAIWATEYGSAFSLITADNDSTVDADYAADIAALGSNIAPLNSVLWISPSNSDGSYAQGQVGYIPSPVPEPATISLFGTGVLGLAGLMRRRLSRSAV